MDFLEAIYQYKVNAQVVKDITSMPASKPTTDNTDSTDKRDNTMSQELIHKELSESIIGAAMTVLNTLRPGLDEKLYERALVIELRKRGHQIEQQREFPV